MSAPEDFVSVEDDGTSVVVWTEDGHPTMLPVPARQAWSVAKAIREALATWPGFGDGSDQ